MVILTQNILWASWKLKNSKTKVLTNSPKSKDIRTHNVARNDKTITAPENKVLTKTEAKGFIVILENQKQ